MTGRNLLAAESRDRLLSCGMARLFVTAREEARTLPTAIQSGVELVELRRRARHLPTVELRNGGVHGGAIGRGVMWGQRNAEAPLIVIAQRAREEGFNRREAERQWRALPRPGLTHGENWKRWGNDGEPIDLGGWFACKRELFKLFAGEVKSLRNKSADLPRPHSAAAPLCSGEG